MSDTLDAPLRTLLLRLAAAAGDPVGIGLDSSEPLHLGAELEPVLGLELDAGFHPSTVDHAVMDVLGESLSLVSHRGGRVQLTRPEGELSALMLEAAFTASASALMLEVGGISRLVELRREPAGEFGLVVELTRAHLSPMLHWSMGVRALELMRALALTSDATLLGAGLNPAARASVELEAASELHLALSAHPWVMVSGPRGFTGLIPVLTSGASPAWLEEIAPLPGVADLRAQLRA